LKDFFRQNGALILAAALLLTAIAGVSSALLNGQADLVSDLVGVVVTPVRNGMGRLANWTDSVRGYLTEYDELQARVAQLEEENAQLREQARDGQSASEENQRLRLLLELREKHRDFVFESATVTAFSPSNWESTLTISKGSNFGIAVNDCVVTETGMLVGVVSEVGYNWATVATVIDSSIEIGGVVSRTDSAGIVEGDFALMGQGKVKLSYLPQSTELIAGDEVLTSGKGGVYPAGLVVGHVEDIRMDESGLTRYAEVLPEVDFAQLIQVFVITDFEIVE
jgi:rod shape-determining protein MreC